MKNLSIIMLIAIGLFSCTKKSNDTIKVVPKVTVDTMTIENPPKKDITYSGVVKELFSNYYYPNYYTSDTTYTSTITIHCIDTANTQVIGSLTRVLFDYAIYHYQTLPINVTLTRNRFGYYSCEPEPDMYINMYITRPDSISLTISKSYLCSDVRDQLQFCALRDKN